MVISQIFVHSVVVCSVQRHSGAPTGVEEIAMTSIQAIIPAPGIVRNDTTQHMRLTTCLITSLLQGGPKNQPCLSVNNLVTVSGRNDCDMSKLLQCCGKSTELAQLCTGVFFA